MSCVVTDFLSAALAEIGVAPGGDVVNGDDMALALFVWNELLDAMNADDRAIYTVTFPQFTLTPNLQPHTIGVSTNTPVPTFAIPAAADGGTGAAGNRPQSILGANLILNTSGLPTNKPLNIRDRNWWLNLRIPTLANPIPTDLYYEPDWPNGSIYLYTIPTTAYGIQLMIGQVLAQMALADTFTLPPGHQQAWRLTLAEALVSPFMVPQPPTLSQRAAEARERVFGANVFIPRLETADSGLAMSGGRRSNFDYRTGQTN